MSYYANVAMVQYLVREIMPLVWARQPDAQLTIADANPTREILAREQQPAVTVLGRRLRPSWREYMMESSTTGVASALLEAAQQSRTHRAARIIARKTQWRLFKAGLVVSDGLMVGLAFRLAYLLRFELQLPIFRLEFPPAAGFYQGVVLFLIPLWLLIFSSLGLYSRKHLLGGTQEYAIVFRATATGLLLVIVAGFLEPVFIIARGWLLLAWLFTFLLTAGGRFLLRRLVYTLRRRGYFLTPAIVVGANAEGFSLAEQLLSWQTSGLSLMGFVDKNVPAGTLLSHKLYNLGSLEQLELLVEQYDVEELILSTSALSRADIIAIFKQYGVSPTVNLRLSSGLYEIITTGLQVNEVAYVPLVVVNKVRLTGIDWLLKLALDYGLALPGLLVAAPLLLLLALAIKLDSPGPVLHRRRVMGVNGRQFDALKFRTMYVNGDEILAGRPELQRQLAREHKLKQDPRITRLGRWLRRFSLDELPQLLNVLAHDMALVGPRMISPEEMAMYNQWDMNLLTVRPGITGLWQVSGRSDVSYEERVRLDMHYIRNWTIWLDLQLLMQTLPAVVRGRGAY
jgi:exopolysaccharide biosynthesis polyprenyl glycosylphosphotransferase